MGGGVKQRPKLNDKRVQWGQVTSDPGQDDGPFQSGDGHDGETLSALGRYAEFGQALREGLEPAVERAPEHLAKRLAGSGGIRCGGSCSPATSRPSRTPT